MIFAVTAEQHNVYEELSKHIEGSSSGVLSEDSDNVVDLVRDQYNVSYLYNTVVCYAQFSMNLIYASIFV